MLPCVDCPELRLTGCCQTAVSHCLQHCPAASLIVCLPSVSRRYGPQVRHPNILAFKDTLELEEKGETVIYLVTEPVTPLATILKQLDIEGAARCQLLAQGSPAAAVASL